MNEKNKGEGQLAPYCMITFNEETQRLDVEQSHRILSSKADDVAVVIIGDVTHQEEQTFHWKCAPGVVAQAQPGPVQVILGANEWHRFDEAKW